jgi:hypothetical protein
MRIQYFFALASLGILEAPLCAQVPIGTVRDTIAHKILNINSKADDYGSFVTRDGLTMYLASNRFGKVHLYMTKRKSPEGAWSEPDYCKITNNPQDLVGSISLDEIGRFYFGTNRETRISGDINIWEGFGLDSVTTIRVLPPPVNTIKWESQPAITADGKNMYFVSNRQSPDGSLVVLNDIFVSHRNSDGSWTDPQNLGSKINFGIHNGTPYITPDGRYLFYSCKEKKGPDEKRKIYWSEHIGPKDVDWSVPVLLPSPINSDKDDMYPMIANGGKTIYFSSNRESGTGLDIYEAELPQKIQAMIAESYARK